MNTSGSTKAVAFTVKSCMEELICRVMEDVCNLPDESSPDDQSPQLRVRADELKAILETHLIPRREPVNWSAP